MRWKNYSPICSTEWELDAASSREERQRFSYYLGQSHFLVDDCVLAATKSELISQPNRILDDRRTLDGSIFASLIKAAAAAAAAGPSALEPPSGLNVGAGRK